MTKPLSTQNKRQNPLTEDLPCPCHCGDRVATLETAAHDLLFHLGRAEVDPETEQAKASLRSALEQT